MKRKLLAMLFLAASLTMSAQDAIQVNYQGAKPTIKDLGWAFLEYYVDEGEEDMVDESSRAIKLAWINQRDGVQLNEGETLTIDEKNGFVLYEWREEENSLRIEMCYWNESDGKHKLFAYNVSSFMNDSYSPGQFDGLVFYRYDNATKKMSFCDETGFEVEYGTDDGGWVSYALPRTGKDIIVTTWYKDRTVQRTLKWNGKTFSWVK